MTEVRHKDVYRNNGFLYAGNEITWSFAFLLSVVTFRDVTRVNIFVVNVLVRICFLCACVCVCVCVCVREREREREIVDSE